MINFAQATVMNHGTSLEHVLNNPLPDTHKREFNMARHELQETNLIDTTIVQARLALEDLQFMPREKHNEVLALKGIVSPLKHIPNELILKIFEAYAQGLSRAPWILGHICSKWRRIALTTPELWTNIFIQLRRTLPIHSAFEKEKTLFARAEKAMISCTLARNKSGPSISSFLPLFIKHASRIRHLVLDRVDAFVPLLASPEAEGALSALERLDLNFSPRNEKILQAVTPGSMTLFRHTPRLYYVTIETSDWTEPSVLLLQLPWAQLTHLLFSPTLTIQSGSLSAILRACHNLVQCRFPFPEEEFDSTVSTSVKLLSLEVLEITHGHETGIGYDGLFLRKLFLPSLQRLIFTSHVEIDVHWPLGDILQFISRSACNIKILHVRCRVVKEWILMLLTVTPSITKLLVQGTCALPTILGAMARRNPFPDLRYIECRSYGAPSGITREIVEALGDDGFMENPSNHTTPLSVHIITNDKSSPAPPLEGLQRNWLKVNLQFIDGELYEEEYEL